MSWKSVPTQFAESAYQQQSKDSKSTPPLSSSALDWATPHPSTLSGKRLGLGLSSRRVHHNVQEVRCPPVAQVLPSMPTHGKHETSNSDYQKLSPVSQCDVFSDTYDVTGHHLMERQSTHQTFTTPNMEDTIDYPTIDNYTMSHQHYDSNHSNRTQSLPAHLTYNPGHYVVTSPKKYSMAASHHSVSTVQDPTKWDALIKAKESILTEKDKIIDKQKMQIHHMQEELRKRESGRLQMVGLNHGDEVIKMQEYQYETAALKAHIAELASSQNTDIHQMSTRLGQTEYELEETQTALKQLALAKKREADLLQKQINEKEEQLDEWTNKFQLFNDKYDKLKNRNDTLERYLEDLPTVEEHKKKSYELKHLKNKDSILAEKINQLEKEVAETRRIIRSKDIKICALESQHSDMKINMEGLENKLSKVDLKKVKVSNTGEMDEDDIEDLQYEHHNMKAECTRLKKLIESKHQKLKTVQNQHQCQIRQLEERIQQEEDTVTALREALSSKEESFKKMQTSMKELAGQSQEMYEHNLNLQDKLQECNQSLSPETLKVYQKLMKELSGCLCDLQGIVQICMQRSQGQDPNMTLLLGLHPSAPIVDSEEPDDFDARNINSMKQKLTQVRQMRQEIEQLRTLITDKYAEDIGDNCITQ